MKTSTICERAELYGMEESKDELFEVVSEKKGEAYARMALSNELTRLILEQAKDDGRLDQELFGNRHDQNNDLFLANGILQQQIVGLNTFREVKFKDGHTETYRGRTTTKLHTIPADEHHNLDNANYFEAQERTAEAQYRPCDAETCEGCDVPSFRCPLYHTTGSCLITSSVHGGKVFHFTNLYAHSGVKDSVKRMIQK